MKFGIHIIKRYLYFFSVFLCRLLKGSAAKDGYDLLYRVLKKDPLLQRELDVSDKIKGDSEVKKLSALLKDSHCRPEILKLVFPLHLNYNNGIKSVLCSVLTCSLPLSVSRVNNCSMRDEGCAALVSALGLKPSHLRELQISRNKLGRSGVKDLSAVLKNQQFNLLTLG